MFRSKNDSNFQERWTSLGFYLLQTVQCNEGQNRNLSKRKWWIVKTLLWFFNVLVCLNLAISWDLYPPPFLKKKITRHMICCGKPWPQPETRGIDSGGHRLVPSILWGASRHSWPPAIVPCAHKAQVTHAFHIVPASLLHTCAATQGISKGPKSLFDQLSTQFWGGLALAKGQTPTQPFSHSSISMGGNTMKSFLVEIKPGKSLANYFHGKIRLSLGKTNLLDIWVHLGSEK